MSVNFSILRGPMAPSASESLQSFDPPPKSEGDLAGELLDHPMVFKIKEGMTHLLLRGIEARHPNFFTVDSFGEIQESEGCGTCSWNTQTQTWDFHSPFGWKKRSPKLSDTLQAAIDDRSGPKIEIPITPGYVPTMNTATRYSLYQNEKPGTFHWEFPCHTGKQFWPMTDEPTCYIYLGNGNFLSVSRWDLSEFVSEIIQRHPAYCQEGLDDFLPLYTQHHGQSLSLQKHSRVLGFTPLFALEPEYRDRVLRNLPNTDEIEWISLSGDEGKIDGHLLVRALEAALAWPKCKGLLLPETLRLKAPTWSIGRIEELVKLLSQKLEFNHLSELESKVRSAIEELIGA